MKRMLFILGIISLSLASYSQTPYYYYYEGKRQYLSLNTEYAFLSVKEQQLPSGIKQRNIEYTDLKSDKSDKKQHHGQKGTNRFWTRINIGEKLSEEQYWELLADMKQQNNDVIIAPYFKTNINNKIGLSNFFYVKLKEEKDIILLRKMAEQTKTIIVEQDAFMPLWFTLSLTEISKLNTLECCNVFYESGLFQAAEPNLIYENILLCVNDPYFDDQWGLKNTGQFGGMPEIDIKACEAWQLSTGSNVKVAIIDVGVQSYHPDLAANMDSLSYNAAGDSVPQHLYLGGTHRTQCAAIVGAVQNNNEGMSGVAPNCRLMPISFDMGVYSPSAPLEFEKHLARGINWAWKNGTDVINNSWVLDTLYGAYIKDAIDSALIRGRNGKGCVMVFAAGNADIPTVAFPARLPSVIAVGAIHPNGHRKALVYDYIYIYEWAGCYGPELDVVAPGVSILVTTCDDYNNVQYGTDLGTSLAAPHVSGVAALILSANPNLTTQQVRDIIESTAQKVGGYNYQTTPGRPNGTWHEEMGYGLVNAYAAVQKAMSMCVDTFTNETVTADRTVIGCDNLEVENVTVTNNAKLTLDAPGTITLGPGFKIELGAELEIK